MNQAYDFDDIDDFLQGRMREADRQAFEQTLASDPELQRQVEALRAEAKVLQLLREEGLLGQFAEWETELERDHVAVPLTASPGGGGKENRYRRWLIPAAAAVVGFVAVGIAFDLFKRGTPDPGIVDKPVLTQPDSSGAQAPILEKNEPYVEQTPKKGADKSPQSTPNAYIAMADRYASGSGDFDQVRGDAAEDDTSRISQAARLYNEKQYKEALSLLQKIDPAQQQQYLYLRALTYYHLGRYEQAGKDFREFRGFDLAEKKYEAQWWEALCLLKQMPGSRAKLVAVLQEMIDTPDHPKGGDATELLQKIK